MKRKNGFTLIELMIVVMLISIIMAIAIPNLLAARMQANEASAISTLRNINSCQVQFRAGAGCDVDDDGIGEFGMFRELSGAVPVRTAVDGTTAGGSVLNPPVLSGAWRTLNPNNEASRSGYLFKMFLPGVAATSVSETPETCPFSGILDSDLCETTWCAYAWPAFYGNSGNRTFFVNQGGEITTSEAAYTNTGSFAVENAGRAFRGVGPLGSITGSQAIGTRGRDGNVWKQVN